MRKAIGLLVLLVLTVALFGLVMLPSVAVAQAAAPAVSATVAVPVDLGVALASLLWLVPLVVAVVNYLKRSDPKMGGSTSAALAIIVGAAVALTVTYFGTLPDWIRIALAGAALGASASGVFDIAKLLGAAPTPTSTAELPAASTR